MFENVYLLIKREIKDYRAKYSKHFAIINYLQFKKYLNNPWFVSLTTGVIICFLLTIIPGSYMRHKQENIFWSEITAADSLWQNYVTMGALNSYQNILNSALPSINPKMYGYLHMQIGSCYGMLYPRNASTNKDNLIKAITSLNQALSIYTPNKDPYNYALTEYYLSIDYKNLSDIEDSEINLQEAMTDSNEALSVCTATRYPVEYAAIMNNIGQCYFQLSNIKDQVNNLNNAIKTYTNGLTALENSSSPNGLDIDPLDVAILLMNLSDAYTTLAGCDDESESESIDNANCAILNCNEALKICNVQDYPYYYAAINDIQGDAYEQFASIRNNNNVVNIQNAEQCLDNSLRIFTCDKYPSEYASDQYDLGRIYKLAADVNSSSNDKLKNLNMALTCFNNALNIYTLDNYASSYADTEKKIGNAYLDLCQYDNSLTNVDSAIQAFNNSLLVFSIDQYPDMYEQDENSLGLSYLFKGSIEDMSGNGERAINEFLKALNACNIIDDPLATADEEYNLGTTYYDLSKITDNNINRNNAVKFLKAVLPIYKSCYPGSNILLEVQSDLSTLNKNN